MTTASILIDQGTTTNLATNTFTEDAVTKHVNRSVLNNSSGVETGVAALPLQVSLANTAANATAVKVDGSAVTQPVSAASLPLPTGASTEATLSTLNGKVTACNTGAIAGTVTANAGTNLNTSLLALESGGNLAAAAASLSVMDDWDETNRCAVNIISGQVGVAGGAGASSALTQRVVIATDQSAVTVTPGKTCKTKTGSASATFTIVAAVTSKKIRAYSLSLMTSSTSAVTVTFKDGAGGTAIGTYLLQAITGTNFGIAENSGGVPAFLFETTAGNLLEMSFSAAVSVTYNLRYWDDD